MGFNSKYYWKGLHACGVLSLSLANLSTNAEDAGNLFNTPYDVNQGERYFERQCSRCHGFDAKGNDETGAPDITGRLSRASTNVGVFNIIREGIPNTAMLPVDSALPDAQVWQLVSYIESLRYDPSTVELAGNADVGDTLFSGKGECRLSYGQRTRWSPRPRPIARR